MPFVNTFTLTMTRHRNEQDKPFLKIIRSLITDHRKTYHSPVLSKVEGSLITYHSRQRRAGYTLIEILVVMSILAILTAFGTYTFENGQKKSRDSRRKEDLKAIKSALFLYYNDHKAYPGNLGTTYASNNMGSFGLTPDYIASLPRDPKQTTNPANCTNQQLIYCYQPRSADTFMLWAQLENTNDREIIGRADSPCTLSPLPPKPSASFNYCIINPN